MQRLRRASRTVLSASLYASIASSAAAAQAERNAYWATVGIGTGTLSSTSTAASLGLWYRTRGHLLAARFLGVDTRGDPLRDPLPLVEEAVSEEAVLYGRGLRGRRTWWSLAVGLSYLTWRRATTRDPFLGGEERESRSAIGFPIAAQLFWTPSIKWGLGLEGFANVNRPRSLAGTLFTVYFGRLR